MLTNINSLKKYVFTLNKTVVDVLIFVFQ